ncbi:hypothetical protein M8J77_002444 [Diaphorina citri]|nr:hypothetical protein M8J77_002444 [Diaphorina citri]
MHSSFLVTIIFLTFLGTLMLISFLLVAPSRVVSLLSRSFLDLRQRNLVPNHNGRILDLVFSSLHTDECMVLQCDPILPVDSHHPPLSFQCVFPVSDEVVDGDYHGFNFRKGDYNLINRTYFETDWRALLSTDSVEDNVHQFYLVVQDVIQLYVPSIHLKKDSYPIWYSPYLKNLIIQKKSEHRLYKSSSSPHHYAEFCRLRSLCKTVSDNCYAKHVSSAEGNIKENPRKTIRLSELNDSLPPSPLLPLTRLDDDARKRTEEGEGYSGIPVCREFPNENPNISDSLAYSTQKSARCNFQE